MKFRQDRAFVISLLFALITFFSLFLHQTARAQQPPIGPGVQLPTQDLSNAKIHAYYFYSNSCAHCINILNDVIYPLEKAHPGLLDIRFLELGNPDIYRALMTAEAHFGVKPEERGLPTTIIGDKIFIGEDQNRESLTKLVQQGLEGSGIPFPTIEGLDPALLLSVPPVPTDNPEICSAENPTTCSVETPIYAAYFYQVGCKDCKRVDSDIKYLVSVYPNLIVEEFNIYEDTAIANWMAERAGRKDGFKVPALFIGEKAWIGAGEITPQAIETEIKNLEGNGSPRFWENYDSKTGNTALLNVFKNISWLNVVFFGLVDGLNPCAFATIIFFVSYLTLSGRKGKEIIITGVSFTVGVFLAYFIVGLGVYKLLDTVKDLLAVAGKVVYALTALLCLYLAYLSIRDYFKVRGGDLADMEMKLPEPLRKRINAAIRKGSKASRYYVGAFVTGILISFLELACTGQVYLPTIIYMVSQPEMRGQSLMYLLLYNIMFIVPLIVVFILAYYGTTSKDLTKFLQKHAAAVKIGMALVFILLAVWLMTSLF